ncbi:sensor histidine kinase [Caulobacter sp. KR2-114]|uniref:sensor histidine kinase n=1 Tax=Caulobacter sp. KR2-114 TaxID=3400912 RepID=UPI003BFBDEA5
MLDETESVTGAGGEGEEARYRAIVDTAVDAIAVIDEDGCLTAFNPAAERLFGYAADEVLGRNVLMLMPEPHHTAHDGYLARYRETGERRIIGIGRQVEGLRKDGATFPLELSVAEWRAGGRRFFTGIMRDITERTQAEQRQRLMVNELNHRVKNTLATVQAVASQTLRTSGSMDQARQALASRLLALAKAHDVLTHESWEGAEIADIVRQALFAGDQARVSAGGDSARLTPKAALALSMILHELFTNAAKYGALSGESGRVEISWRRLDEGLTVAWRERDGPPVSAPDHRGFGSRMIEALARDLDGVARLNFPADGLVCEVEAGALSLSGGGARRRAHG